MSDYDPLQSYRDQRERARRSQKDATRKAFLAQLYRIRAYLKDNMGVMDSALGDIAALRQASPEMLSQEMGRMKKMAGDRWEEARSYTPGSQPQQSSTTASGAEQFQGFDTKAARNQRARDQFVPQPEGVTPALRKGPTGDEQLRPFERPAPGTGVAGASVGPTGYNVGGMAFVPTMDQHMNDKIPGWNNMNRQQRREAMQRHIGQNGPSPSGRYVGGPQKSPGYVPRAEPLQPGEFRRVEHAHGTGVVGRPDDTPPGGLSYVGDGTGLSDAIADQRAHNPPRRAPGQPANFQPQAMTAGGPQIVQPTQPPNPNNQSANTTALDRIAEPKLTPEQRKARRKA